ncbi:hypothetical protein N7452_011268 [Penicillium brevicompactum]|uniref:Uncharacterized protein n=1 Tax=Penicillium brevicompactum TaxID=5074 RepID=A0A9W9Q260_PENBR|nr:hypothetical protein N7452_011268 [Penicillium brevicompactum]
MASQQNGEAYEQENVHEVYQQIAQHFSATRYKPWPIVERFLTELSPGAVGLDVGCGNGKNLMVNRDVFIVASDSRGRDPAHSEAGFTDARGGKVLVYAWALEQKNSRRGWDKGDEQDRMVPWVRKGDQPQTFHRYYHLYEEGELERDIENAGGRVLESGYEKDNWWAIATPQTGQA